MNVTDEHPTAIDAALSIVVALTIGAVCFLVWWTAAGRFAEPGRITIPTTTPPVIYEETP